MDESLRLRMATESLRIAGRRRMRDSVEGFVTAVNRCVGEQ
jgi:hypothetical protein